MNEDCNDYKRVAYLGLNFTPHCTNARLGRLTSALRETDVSQHNGVPISVQISRPYLRYKREIFTLP